MRNTTLYIIPGTKTFRLASRKFITGCGSNLQNIERTARELYIADDGKILIQVDQAGAEALIVAYCCRYGNFRSLFIHNIKPHVFVALHLFPSKWQKKINSGTLDIKCDISELLLLPIDKLQTHPFWKPVEKLIKSSDDWPSEERYYYIAKQVCHSSNYGIKAGMFCLNSLEKSKGKIVLQKKDAEKFLELYHGLFPEIREWHLDVVRQVQATRTLYNLLGNPIYISTDINDESLFKELYATIPQSTVASITRVAYTQLQSLIEAGKYNWDILNDNHDSYLAQSPIDESMLCAKWMKNFIEQELVSPKDGTKFRMKSEVKMGNNWSPYEEIRNPKGLKEVFVV